MFALEKFHQYTYRRQVMVQNDHKPLVVVQRKPISKAPMRLQRMLLSLTTYDYEIVHVPGKDMHFADALSRAYLQDRREHGTFDTVSSVIMSDWIVEELQEFQEATTADDQLIELRNVVLNGWPNEKPRCPPLLTQVWDFRDVLTVHDNVIGKRGKR